jgi:hypothetical protein
MFQRGNHYWLNVPYIVPLLLLLRTCWGILLKLFKNPLKTKKNTMRTFWGTHWEHQNPTKKKKNQNHLEINFGTMPPKNKSKRAFHLNLELNLLIKVGTNRTRTNWSIKIETQPQNCRVLTLLKNISPTPKMRGVFQSFKLKKTLSKPQPNG